MSGKTIRIAVEKAAGGGIGTYTLPATATVLDLKTAIARDKGASAYPIERQALSAIVDNEKIQLNDPIRELTSFGLRNDSQVFLKKLGPQMKFITVYILEYLGPLVLYPLVALLTGPMSRLSPIQNIAMFLWIVHFSKRILETIFVHDFGNMTMPVFPNLFRNCAYYWFFGAFCGYNVNKKWDEELPKWHLYIGFLSFAICMFMNLICHIQLKMLGQQRKPGSTALLMPSGGFFDLVTAPNYLFEILTWVSFNILTGFTLSGVSFLFCGAYQMNQWATEKHLKYKKLFPNYPRSRKMLIPYIY